MSKDCKHYWDLSTIEVDEKTGKIEVTLACNKCNTSVKCLGNLK